MTSSDRPSTTGATTIGSTVSVAPWGALGDRPLHRITLDDGVVRVVLVDLGARLLELHAPDRDGALADLVLGYPDVESHVPGPAYFGATCGRYANRIARGRFELDGHGVQVSCNEGANHLHGGTVGWDQYVWSFDVDDAGGAVRFTHHAPDCDEGFPGAVEATSTYALAGGVLSVRMTATTDAPTVVNMVNHAYWNLAGHASGDVLAHEIDLASDLYTPVDDELLPTGEVRRVDGTPYDLRGRTTIGARLREVDHGGAGRAAPAGVAGYDHNFVLRGQVGHLHPCLTVVDPVSGRRLDVRTTEPAVQFYTAGYLDGVAGKEGAVYQPFQGFTLETQRFPDSPNHGHFPSTVLRPGEVYDHRTELALSIEP